MLDHEGVIQQGDVISDAGVDHDEFLAVFHYRHEIAAGQIGAGRKTREMLPCISLEEDWSVKEDWSMAWF
jgi:hypothetical protein